MTPFATILTDIAEARELLSWSLKNGLAVSYGRARDAVERLERAEGALKAMAIPPREQPSAGAMIGGGSRSHTYQAAGNRVGGGGGSWQTYQQAMNEANRQNLAQDDANFRQLLAGWTENQARASGAQSNQLSYQGGAQMHGVAQQAAQFGHVAQRGPDAMTGADDVQAGQQSGGGCFHYQPLRND